MSRRTLLGRQAGPSRQKLAKAEAIALLLLRVALLYSPLSQVSGQEGQAGEISECQKTCPDPQDPPRPSWCTPRPQAQPLGSIPDGQHGNAKSNDDVDNSGWVETFGLVAQDTE